MSTILTSLIKKLTKTFLGVVLVTLMLTPYIATAYGADVTRGIRNNNPGNIERIVTNKWMGEVECEDKRFTCFEDASYGIRAIIKTLLTYNTKYGIDTVAGVMNRWAPYPENQTQHLATVVSSVLKVSPSEKLNIYDPTTMFALVSAIMYIENGILPYDPNDIYTVVLTVFVMEGIVEIIE